MVQISQTSVQKQHLLMHRCRSLHIILILGLFIVICFSFAFARLPWTSGGNQAAFLRNEASPPLLDEVEASIADELDDNKNEQEENDRPWLNGEPTTVQLQSRQEQSQDTDLYHFALPATSSLGISICSCILVTDPESRITRPYTPISKPNTKGYFTLLVKRYEDGAMSQVFDKLKPGDSLQIKQIPFNIKIQYPFDNPSKILMLAAGTGITPMYQALQRMFGTHKHGSSKLNARVILVFGVRTLKDVYLREELEAMQRRHPRRLRIHYAISQLEDDDKDKETSDIGIRHGRIDKALMEEILNQEDMLSNKEQSKIFVCGPPSFYDTFCGPRRDPKLAGILGEYGFDSDQVIKF